MQLEVYNAVKTQLETISALKEVGLWNNQFARESENVSFGYPCAFIEFANIEYSDLTNGLQRYGMDVAIHLGFESYKNEDTPILTLKQTIHSKLHMFTSATSKYDTKLLRRSEAQDFDHQNVQDYQLTYRVTGTDYSITNLPGTDATVTTLTAITDPQISNFTIRTDSPDIT